MRIEGLGWNVRKTAAGAEGNLPLGWQGEVVVADPVLEASLRGLAFVASVAVAGVAPGTALGTTVPFTLYNPKSSGKLLIPIEVSLGYVSGTLGAGTIAYVTSATITEAAPAGTALTARSTKIGSSTAATGQAAVTVTVAANSLLVGPAFNLQASLASTAVAPYEVRDRCFGRFVITEGAYLGLQGIAAAGTSPLVMLGMSWVEVPV